MSTKAQTYPYSGYATWLESTTHERVFIGAPISFTDDFLGAGPGAGVPAAGSPVLGYPWVKKLQGTPTGVAIVANGLGGLMQCALAATSEKEEATLYQNDQLTWDSTKTIIYQSRVKLSVLPSATGVEAVWGLSSAWIDGPDNATYYIEFGITGSGGGLNMRVQDGVSQRAVSTGYTVDTNFHLYRSEMDTSGDLHFYVDGTEYSTSTSPLTWGATSAPLQLYHSVYKPSGTGVATMVTDSINAWSPRT